MGSSIRLAQCICVEKITWHASQLVDDVDAEIAREPVQFLLRLWIGTQGGVGKESLIKRPFAECKVLQGVPNFCAAWLD